jgi:hypothetical protein
MAEGDSEGALGDEVEPAGSFARSSMIAAMSFGPREPASWLNSPGQGCGVRMTRDFCINLQKPSEKTNKVNHSVLLGRSHAESWHPSAAGRTRIRM